jgi:Flp pilus assembly protein TadG
MTHERRQDAAIMAIIVPVILVIVVGVADLVQLGTAQTNLNQVAQTSAACITTPGCIVKAEAARSAKALGMNPDFLDVNVQGKVVTLAYVAHGYLPLLPSRHCSASATAP